MNKNKNCARSNEVLQKIDHYKSKHHKPNNEIIGSNSAFNIAIEFLAAICVGVIIGLMLDKIFTTKPIFLIICLVLSNIAAMRLIWQKYLIKKKNDNGT